MRPTRRHIALDMRFGSNRVEYQPLGVVGIISPWNYPVNLSLMPAVTAIVINATPPTDGVPRCRMQTPPSSPALPPVLATPKGKKQCLLSN